MAAAGANNSAADRNTEATVHVGQLDPRVTDEQLWEFMVQAGPVKHVYIPRDRITGNHHGYGFCEFKSELDAAYAAKVLNMTLLHAKPIRLAQSSADRHAHDVGANLFVGNLAPSVDEKLLYEAFSAFGPVVDAPHVMKDPDSGASKGFGFVKFASFDASDKAVATMHGQYVCNQPLVVQYAFKKDGGGRERHGSDAERTLAAASARASATSVASTLVPHTLFADRPASALHQPPPPPPGMPQMMRQVPVPQHAFPHPQTRYAPPPGYAGPPGYAAVPGYVGPSGYAGAPGGARFPQYQQQAPPAHHPVPYFVPPPPGLLPGMAQQQYRAFPGAPPGGVYQPPPPPAARSDLPGHQRFANQAPQMFNPPPRPPTSGGSAQPPWRGEVASVPDAPPPPPPS